MDRADELPTTYQNYFVYFLLFIATSCQMLLNSLEDLRIIIIEELEVRQIFTQNDAINAWIQSIASRDRYYCQKYIKVNEIFRITVD